MPSDWNECLKEGDESFDYMLHHFHDMFDCNSIKHFDIRYTSNMTMSYYDDIREEYGKDIHKNLVPWIHKEYRCGRLFEKERWKVYRDSYVYTEAYLGYRTLFQYHDYYFQLIIAIGCRHHICVDCDKCEAENNMIDNGIHFDVGLYGWKEGERLQPEEQLIQSDLEIPYT